MLQRIVFTAGQLKERVDQGLTEWVRWVVSRHAATGVEVVVNPSLFLCQMRHFFSGFDVRCIGCHGAFVRLNRLGVHVVSLLNGAKIEPAGRMR